MLLWHAVCLVYCVSQSNQEEAPMSHTPSTKTTQLEQLPTDIQKLAAAIQQLPQPQREQVEPAFRRVLESTNRRRRILGLVQDALSQLRLDMK